MAHISSAICEIEALLQTKMTDPRCSGHNPKNHIYPVLEKTRFGSIQYVCVCLCLYVKNELPLFSQLDTHRICAQ